MPDVDDGGFADWYKEYSGGEEVPTSYQEPQGSPSPAPSGDGGNGGGGGGGGTPGGSLEEGYDIPGLIDPTEYGEKYPEIPTVHQLWDERASILSDVARDIISTISSPGGVWAPFAYPGSRDITTLEGQPHTEFLAWGLDWSFLDPGLDKEERDKKFCELYPWHPACWGDGNGGGFNFQFPSFGLSFPGQGASDWEWLIWLALGGAVFFVLYKWATKKEVEIKYVEEH